MNGPLYTEDDVKADVQPNKTNDPSGFYSTDTFTDKMLGYLADRPDKNKPFFGYLAYSSPHWPLQVGKEWRDKYKGVYSDGPEALRQRRLANLKKSGLIPEHAVAHDVVASESSEWEQLTEEQKQLSGSSHGDVRWDGRKSGLEYW
ncbi:hypothetical protein QCA50_000761 [Cerrena zonata]|uniref:Sulfatase N-terminal domain-containing protein n=1 Tax=Cerrena zonata TaxID=2478898 RepID=A0AAW0GR94_9APHY